jgi:ferredoxin
MSLFYYVKTGILHPLHPAGLFILVAIILFSLLVGKSFCSWLCPVGFLSELLGDMGKKLFGRTLKPPRWLDYPLRSLKYLLLAFFLYSIMMMTTAGLRAFLDSPYNQVADVKMYYFFADIGHTALIVLGVLFLLSIVIRNFWCRYLCPYGALLGLVSLVSPQKIRRDPVACIDCAKCALACPSRIKVDKVRTVISDECTGCLNCVDVCPVKDTLWLESVPLKRRVPKRLVPALVVGGFVLITGLAMLTGHWQNNMSVNDYIRQRAAIRMYGHPTSLKDISRMNQQAQPRK